MSSALGDKKGRVADSSDLTRLQRESAVLAAYTTYTGLSVAKKANRQVGNDRKFTLTRGGLTLISDATTGVTRNPITGQIVVAPYTRSPPQPPAPIYAQVFAIPNFTIPNVTYVSGDGTSPYVVTYLGQTYTAVGTRFFGGTRAPQYVFLRTTTTPASGVNQWGTTGGAYNSVTGIAAGVTTTTVGGTTVTGEYLQITAPTAFVLSSYTLLPGFIGSIPDDWIVAGSNDGGTTFTVVDTQTGQWLPFVNLVGGVTYISRSFSLPTNTASYSTYRIIFTRVSPGTTTVGVTTWNLFTNGAQIN